MRKLIRCFVIAAACVGAAASLTPARAQYPGKPVRIIVPFAPGGPSDLVTRVVAERLADKWKQAVLVDNRPGASGVIATQALIASAPDGYTLMLHNASGMTIYPSVARTPPYDTLRDLTPISPAAFSALVLVVGRAMPFDDVKGLVEYLKANPGRTSYASGGVGLMNHIGGEMLKRQTGTDVAHVPYKGDAPAVADLVNGNVTMAFLSANLVIPQIKAGKLKGLAVTSRVRSDSSPELPTMIEAGFPDFELRAWNGFLGPAGMPKELVGQINQAIGEVLGRADVRSRLAQLGLIAESSTPEAFVDRIKTETEKWRAVVKSAGIVGE